MNPASTFMVIKTADGRVQVYPCKVTRATLRGQTKISCMYKPTGVPIVKATITIGRVAFAEAKLTHGPQLYTGSSVELGSDF